MLAALSQLLQSRKAWVGIITILAMVGAMGLVGLGKLDPAALVSTIAAVAGIGIATIGSIAWEDSSKNRADSNAKNGQVVADAITVAVKTLAPPPLPKDLIDDNRTP